MDGGQWTVPTRGQWVSALTVELSGRADIFVVYSTTAEQTTKSKVQILIVGIR